jgi:hypothetical protein
MLRSNRGGNYHIRSKRKDARYPLFVRRKSRWPDTMESIIVMLLLRRMVWIFCSYMGGYHHHASFDRGGCSDTSILLWRVSHLPAAEWTDKQDLLSSDSNGADCRDATQDLPFVRLNQFGRMVRIFNSYNGEYHRRASIMENGSDISLLRGGYHHFLCKKER